MQACAHIICQCRYGQWDRRDEIGMFALDDHVEAAIDIRPNSEAANVHPWLQEGIFPCLTSHFFQMAEQFIFGYLKGFTQDNGGPFNACETEALHLQPLDFMLVRLSIHEQHLAFAIIGRWL